MMSGWLAAEGRRSLRGWAPCVGLSAGLFLVMALFGAVGGVRLGSVPFAPFASRGPAVPAPSPGALEPFVHNGAVATATVVSAPLSGLPALLVQAHDGLVFGGIVAVTADRLGPVTALLLPAPHGVFELPALA